MPSERHVRLFRNGGNQAIRIPREFELAGDEVILRREGDWLIIELVVERGPHFHAYWQDQMAVVGIDPIGVIAGSLPTRQRRLVEAWAELRKEELRDDWNRLQQGQPPMPIEPLA